MGELVRLPYPGDPGETKGILLFYYRLQRGWDTYLGKGSLLKNSGVGKKRLFKKKTESAKGTKVRRGVMVWFKNIA